MQQTITLIVDSDTFEMVSQRAKAENTTLNALFRVWMEGYVAQPAATADYNALMAQLSHVDAGRRFDRDEMNERR